MNNPAANRRTQPNSMKKALPVSRKIFYSVAIGSATLVLFSVISMWVMGRELSEKSQKVNEVVGHVKLLEERSLSFEVQTSVLKDKTKELEETVAAHQKYREKIETENKELKKDNQELQKDNTDLTKKYRERRDALEKKRLNTIALNKVNEIPVVAKTFAKANTLSINSINSIQTTNNVNEIENAPHDGVFSASFYTPHCAEGCTGKTASGTPAKPGVTIAVDTRYWKLGTRFYVEGFGVLIAQDTGGAIKGKNRVDICVSSTKEALKLGKQKLKYWVLENN